MTRAVRSRRIRWAGHGREEKCIKCFGRKTYRKETL